MAVGDIEYPLKRGPSKRITQWASAWLDLLQAGQMLHAFLQVPRDNIAQNLFQRRALIDDAVISYARSFTTGTRHGVVTLLPWIDELGVESRALHDEAMRWRNEHIAHRDDQDLEHMDISLLWERFGSSAPGLRLRLETSLGPAEDFARDLLTMAETLRNWIWERELWPQQQSWLQALGPAAIDGMKQKARPAPEPVSVINSYRVTQDIGSEQPPPTPAYRRLPSRLPRARQPRHSN